MVAVEHERQVIDLIADEMIQRLYRNLFDSCMFRESITPEVLKSLLERFKQDRMQVQEIREALYESIKDFINF